MIDLLVKSMTTGWNDASNSWLVHRILQDVAVWHPGPMEFSSGRPRPRVNVSPTEPIRGFGHGSSDGSTLLAIDDCSKSNFESRVSV
jgi:hypothetical protein